jgi:hypothetical protein
VNIGSAFGIVGIIFMSTQEFNTMLAQKPADEVIIPAPVSVIKAPGTFTFPRKKRIKYSLPGHLAFLLTPAAQLLNLINPIILDRIIGAAK